MPGASSSNSNSGVTPRITEAASALSNTQPVVPAESSDSSENDEETTRPSARFCSEGPPQSHLPDDTITLAAPVAFAPTLAPSDNGEGSSGNGCRKKRTRDAEEDEEQTARPSTRMRQEPPTVRPRCPSPTPSDRRMGPITAPFRSSFRFNPRPSPEADIESLGVARNEGNPSYNLPASSSGSSTLPLVSSNFPSASRSSQMIKHRGAREVSKKE